ncbi:MAG: hypothetical protein ABEK59_00995 [Halobacteria archaeon]
MVDRKRDDGGQVHTLEGVSAAVLIILTATFMVQSLAITPTSSSTASKEVETQMKVIGEDLLDKTYSTGGLREALLNWNGTGGNFVDAGTKGFYRGRGMPGKFGDDLNQTYFQKGIAYNIELTYRRSGTNDTATTTLVTNGEPTTNAVTVNRLIVLYDDDTLTGSSKQLGEAVDYPIENLDSPDLIFNVVEVRLTAWRK